MGFRDYKKSHPVVFYEKGRLENFEKFAKKHLCWSLKESPTQVFFC